MLHIILDEFRNVITLLMLEFVLAVPYLKKRKRYPLRILISVSCCLAFTLCYYFILNYIRSVGYGGFVIFISSLWYVTVALTTGGVILFCHEANKTEIVWILITAYALKHLIYVTVVEFFYFGILKQSTNFWGQALSSVTLTAVILPVEYLLFVGKNGCTGKLNLKDDALNFVVLLCFFAVFFASTFINQANARGSDINYLSMISDIVNCIFVVTVQYYSLRNARIRYDKASVEMALENEKKRYETFKNSVDYINIKCHDLKREIKAIKNLGGYNVEKLDEIIESVAVYESFADTGNKVLDTILTDVNFTCLNEKISFSCIADASGLSDMKDEEVYSLFGNLLDNAVEYVKDLKDENKKFIRFFIKREGNLNVIHQENYFDGDLVFSDGVPVTTKSDKLNHGFGTKSMRQIVKKHGGEMQISAKDGLFKIDIVLSR